MVLNKTGKHEEAREALESYNRAIEIGPNFETAWRGFTSSVI
jgi:hypothetical protein